MYSLPHIPESIEFVNKCMYLHNLLDDLRIITEVEHHDTCKSYMQQAVPMYSPLSPCGNTSCNWLSVHTASDLPAVYFSSFHEALDKI